jgi:hypothetical protein
MVLGLFLREARLWLQAGGAAVALAWSDADTLMRARTAPVAALLFASIFCALVPGQLAARVPLISARPASAAVLAIFIGGLASAAPARFAPTVIPAAAVLRHAESIVAVMARAQPAPLLAGAHDLSAAAAQPSGHAAATAERLVLSVIVLAVPTIAWAGALPAAARRHTVRRQRRQNSDALRAEHAGAVAGA